MRLACCAAVDRSFADAPRLLRRRHRVEPAAGCIRRIYPASTRIAANYKVAWPDRDRWGHPGSCISAYRHLILMSLRALQQQLSDGLLLPPSPDSLTTQLLVTAVLYAAYARSLWLVTDVDRVALLSALGLALYAAEQHSRHQRLHVFRLVELPQATRRLWVFNASATLLSASLILCALASSANVLRYQSSRATSENHIITPARGLQIAAQSVFSWTIWTVACERAYVLAPSSHRSVSIIIQSRARLHCYGYVTLRPVLAFVTQIAVPILAIIANVVTKCARQCRRTALIRRSGLAIAAADDLLESGWTLYKTIDAVLAGAASQLNLAAAQAAFLAARTVAVDRELRAGYALLAAPAACLFVRRCARTLTDI